VNGLGRKRGYCGDGDYKVVSLNLARLLKEKIDEYVDRTGRGVNEVASKGFCHELGLDWESVKAENEVKYPRRP
jgi:hypothetical protein